MSENSGAEFKMPMICQSSLPKLTPSHNTLPLFSFLTPNFNVNFTPHSSNFNLKPHFKLKLKRCCSNNEQPHQVLEGFSALEADPPWESRNVWSTMGLYFFSLHIPLSFGGLSFVADLLHQPVLDPQFKAVTVLVIGTLELFAAVLLLQFTAKPDSKSIRLLVSGNIQSKRSWVFASLLSFVVLVAAMYLISDLADRLVGNEGVNNQTVKEILLSGSVGQTSITLVYCIVAPLLEEIIYRRFLLTSLASSMQWQQALVLSSVIFAAAHLSGENFIQLFLIGMVLGCSYCWTGDLRSSLLVHSAYNALTLFLDINT